MATVLARTVRSLCALGMVMLLLPVLPASADDIGTAFTASGGTTSGQTVSSGTALTYTILSDASGSEPGTVEVGNASTAALDTGYAGAVTIPDTVSYGGCDYTVTLVSYRAFIFSSLTSVTLPDTLQRIGPEAFYNCYSLAHLSFGANPVITAIRDSAFYLAKCTGGLEELDLPASLQTIGAYAFYGQATITDLTFPCKSMERIGNYAFAECTSLKSTEVPAITATSTGLGGRAFYNDTSLTKAVFLGDIASADISIDGSRTFEGCTALATVVYHGKKFIPYFADHGRVFYVGFYKADPTLYYTLTYYPSKQDAEDGTDALGYVRVRDDTPVRDIAPGMAESDSDGAIVYEGAPISCPDGYSGWAYEGSPILSDAISDSMYAYPVDAHDLSYASIELASGSYDYTGCPITPSMTICDASGSLLSGSDYTVEYLRKGGDGTYAPTTDLTSPGSMRVAVTGTGSYQGTLSADYSIAYAAVGSTFQDSSGITYKVTASYDGSKPGSVVVGDGTNLATSSGTTGAIDIPATVSPAGSTALYGVVGISDYAFGGESSAKACTGLTGVDIPDTVTSIGNYAFGYCSGLEAVTIPASVRTLGARVFQNCVSLATLEFSGDSIASMGTYCFAQCAALTEVTLPSFEGSNSFYDHVFCNCVKLQRVVFSGSVPAAGSTQFNGCGRLTRVIYRKAVWQGTFESNPAIYLDVTFYSGTTVLSTATIELGTRLSSVTSSLSSPQVLEGSIPQLPSGSGAWGFQCTSGSVLDAPCTARAIGLSVGRSATVGSASTKATYKVTGNSTPTATYARCRTTARTVTIPATVTLNGRKYTVTRVASGAFKGCKARAVKVLSKKIVSFAGAFTSSRVDKVYVPSSKRSAYRKLLTKARCGRAVRVI